MSESSSENNFINIPSKNAFLLYKSNDYLYLKNFSLSKNKLVKLISLLNNFNKGFDQKYFYKLKLDGVGFRFLDITENELILKVGFSNVVKFNLNPSVFAMLLSNVELLLYSSDYDLLKSTSASIKKIRVPDIYKGKGIKYFDETISLKEIKK